MTEVEVLRILIRRVRDGRPTAAATVVSGSSGVGRKLLAGPSGLLAGGLGDGELDRAVLARIPRALREGRPAEIEVGGRRVFLEVHLPPPRLVIVGAVHIAITLGRLARELGFRVVVTDARSRFATPERFPDADELILGWPAETLPRLELDAFSHVVVMTHDPKLDNPALAAALRSPAPYVGALGSKKTHARRVEALGAEGLADEEIDRIHAPVGLDIGARTPQEIALATLAQIVAVRNAREAAEG